MEGNGAIIVTNDQVVISAAAGRKELVVASQITDLEGYREQYKWATRWRVALQSDAFDAKVSMIGRSSDRPPALAKLRAQVGKQAGYLLESEEASRASAPASGGHRGPSQASKILAAGAATTMTGCLMTVVGMVFLFILLALLFG